MTETQYLLQSLAQGPYKKKSYESDLSKLPPKYQPKYNSSDPGLAGFAGGFAGDWPGMKLRKTADSPDFKYDYYNPLTRDAVPNEFGSPEEQLDYESGQGGGQLAAAATLLPGLLKNGGRMMLSALGGKNLNAARGEAARAAELMNPRAGDDVLKSALEEIPGSYAKVDAPAMANAAGKKVLTGEQALREAGQFGESFNPAIQASRRLLTAKAGGAGVDALLGGARNSVDAEDDANFSVLGADQDRVHPELADAVAGPASSPAADYASAMAGRKPITPYQQKNSLLEKLAYAIFPEEGRQNEERHRRAYEQDQMARESYLDPVTAAKMQDIGLDKASGRAATLQSTGADQQLRNVLAPTMSSHALEALLKTPSGTIDPKRLDRMTRQGDPVAMLRELFPNGLGGGTSGPGQIQQQGPVINVPRQIPRRH